MSIEEEFRLMQLEYIDIMSEDLDQLQGLFNDLNEENYPELIRKVHSIKGTAGTYGFDLVSIICHKIEDILAKNEESISESSRDEIFKYFDIARDYVDAWKDKDDSKVEALKNLVIFDEKEQTSHRVLFIESSKVQRKIITNELQKHGVNISYCDNGITAIQRYMSEKFDSILCSSELKGLDGLSLLRTFKVITSPINNNIPCLLITSSELEKDDSKINPDYVLRKNKDLVEKLGDLYEATITSRN